MEYKITFNNEEYILIDVGRGFLTNSQFIDSVFLIGKRPYKEEKAYYDDLIIVIENYETGTRIHQEIEDYSGYSPKLFIGKFKDMKNDDILFSMFSGKGDITYYLIYEVDNKKFNIIFSHNKFNNQYKYLVEFMDNYKVKVVNETIGEEYLIDISNREDYFLNQFYNKDGTLIEQTNGKVIDLGGLYPIDFELNGRYELYSIQRIIGKNDRQNIGGLNSMIRWIEDDFYAYNQYAWGIGQDIKINK